MPSLASSFFLPPFSITILIIIACSSRRTTSIYLTYCSGANFTSPSAYETLLTRLLTILVASTPTSPTLYTTSAYPKSSSPQIFGLAQCRPDSPAYQCYLCLNGSAALAGADIIDGCGKSKSTAFRSDYCLLRYSDQPFFGVVERHLFVSSGMRADNAPQSFRLRVNNLMESLIQSAVASSINFAVGMSNSSDGPWPIYGMMWCSMDLSLQGDCEQCLRETMEEAKHGKVRGRAATVSCEVRYEVHRFYSTLLFPEAVPLTGRKEKWGDKTISIIAASGAGAILLFIIIFTILLQRWKRLLAKVNQRNMECYQYSIK